MKVTNVKIETVVNKVKYNATVDLDDTFRFSGIEIIVGKPPECIPTIIIPDDIKFLDEDLHEEIASAILKEYY